MECFCGCGRKVPRFPLGVRSINKRGAIIASDLASMMTLIEAGMVSPNAFAYEKEAREALGALAEAVHERTDPGPAAEAETRVVMAWGREVPARLGAAVSGSGMSEEEAMEAIRRGDLDPFEDAPVRLYYEI